MYLVGFIYKIVQGCTLNKTLNSSVLLAVVGKFSSLTHVNSCHVLHIIMYQILYNIAWKVVADYELKLHSGNKEVV